MSKAVPQKPKKATPSNKVVAKKAAHKTPAAKTAAAVKRTVPAAALKVPKRKLTIMVSSTVYGSEALLTQIAAVLRQRYGYDVVMSKEGSVYVPIGSSNKEACLKAVADCDLFFGIIFFRYGSGITFDEFAEAVNLDKPRWFVVDSRVEFVRKLLQPVMFDDKNRRTVFDMRSTSVLDSIKVVDMYMLTRDHWAQPFSTDDEVLTFVDTQFGDMKRRLKELQALKHSKA